jgi:hypothetical protein
MTLNGVNKVCAQCNQECKQWQQIEILYCSVFKSKQQKSAGTEEGDTLQASQN